MKDITELDLSPSDERYLNSPSFENYMIAGGVFILGLTISIVGTKLIHQEPWFWPGSILSVIIAFVVLYKLNRREYRAKLREILKNPEIGDHSRNYR